MRQTFPNVARKYFSQCCPKKGREPGSHFNPAPPPLPLPFCLIDGNINIHKHLNLPPPPSLTFCFKCQQRKVSTLAMPRIQSSYTNTQVPTNSFRITLQNNQPWQNIYSCILNHRLTKKIEKLRTCVVRYTWQNITGKYTLEIEVWKLLLIAFTWSRGLRTLCNGPEIWKSPQPTNQVM